MKVSSCCRGDSAPNLNCRKWKLPRGLTVSAEAYYTCWLIRASKTAGKQANNLVGFQLGAPGKLTGCEDNFSRLV